MNINTLRAALASRWSFLLHGWDCRETIHYLIRVCEDIPSVTMRDAERMAEIERLTELVNKQNAEKEFLTKQLEVERKDKDKNLRIIASLWKFIHTAHRLSQDAMPGTLRHLLQESQK